MLRLLMISGNFRVQHVASGNQEPALQGLLERITEGIRHFTSHCACDFVIKSALILITIPFNSDIPSASAHKVFADMSQIIEKLSTFPKSQSWKITG